MQSVAINARFLTRRATGVDRFARELIAVIDGWVGQQSEESTGLTFEVLVPTNIDAATRFFDNLSVRKVGTHRGQAWEQLDLPRAMRPGQWLLNLCNTAPVLVRRQVVAIHDASTVSVPYAYSIGFRLWYRLLMPLLGWRARRIVTVSQFSREELARHFAISPARISLISESGEHITRCPGDPGVLHRFDLQTRPYILAVSSMAAHKNFELVLKASTMLPGVPFDIAIVGGNNSRVFGSLPGVHAERVKWLGYVSDAELRSLYESAVCFVFPSLYEGFGIPTLEAMHCGCPVIASDAASIPEVCGEAALYFDPRSAPALAQLLRRMLTDTALRQRLRELGFARASTYSWEIGARQLLKVCREAMAQYG
jgi:glycosyltransferase involved in cell wall biosynthesis